MSIASRPKVARWKDFDESDGAQFMGYVGRDMKMRTNGDLEMVIVVPYEFKHLAVGLSDAMGMPLTFDVQVWKPYLDQKIDRERTKDREEQVDRGTKVV